MKKDQLNVGHINFLNCLPLTYSFGRGAHDLNIIADMPANLNKAIINGGLDISPVSSIVYAQNSDKLLLLPDVSITADGSVQSIILVSHRPIELLERAKIVLTEKSATSHCLLKIIMNKAYNVEPLYEVRAVSMASGIPSDATAMLLIGDDALFAHHNRIDGLFYYDLGLEWKKLTGMRMVYAVWVARKELAVADNASIIKAYKAIIDGFTYGCEHKEAAIHSVKGKTSFTDEQLMEYLTVIQWDFTSEHRASLAKFYELAQSMGLLTDVPELATVEVGK